MVSAHVGGLHKKTLKSALEWCCHSGRVHSERGALAHEATAQPLNSCSRLVKCHKTELITRGFLQNLLVLNHGE